MRSLWMGVLAACGCVHDTQPRVASAKSIVLHEEAVIAAPPSRIWQLLTDFPGYASWNPWLFKVEGQPVPGSVVWADLVLGQKKMHAKHVVLAVEPEARLCWRDAGWTTSFAYGQRCRWLEPKEDGTVRFRQELLLEGPFRRLALDRYGAAMRAGMAAETAALKRRAEEKQ